MTSRDRRATIHARASALAGVQAKTKAETAPDAPDAPSKAELWLYGVVGGYYFGFNAKSVADALRGLEVDELQVRLHSPGGDAIDGIAIGNLLRNHQARVTVVVDGLAASAASMIALAGDEVVMSPGAQFMLHDPWMLTVGNAAELRSDAGFLDKQAENYAGVYAHRTGGSQADWRAVMLADEGRGTWYTAQEAVDAGLADRVGTVTSSSAPPADPAEGIETEEAAARAAWDLEVLVHPAARAAWRPAAPKPPTASAGGSTPTQGTESAVAFSDEQMKTMRQQLGVAEDADEATILAAFSEALDEQTREPAATAPEVPEGMVLVDSEVLNNLRSGAEAGRTAREELDNQARDRAIDAAIQAGKTTVARREHWVKSWKADSEGTQALLDSLEPGLAVPVAEIGNGGETETDNDDPFAGVSDEAIEALAASIGTTKEALRG